MKAKAKYNDMYSFFKNVDTQVMLLQAVKIMSLLENMNIGICNFPPSRTSIALFPHKQIN